MRNTVIVWYGVVVLKEIIVRQGNLSGEGLWRQGFLRPWAMVTPPCVTMNL